MAKTLSGIVISTKMTNSAVIEVTRKIPHPKYKKLLKRSKKYAVAVNGHNIAVGDMVEIIETRPISKTIHYMISKTQQKNERVKEKVKKTEEAKA